MSPFRGEHRDRKTGGQRSDQGQPGSDATASVAAREGGGDRPISLPLLHSATRGRTDGVKQAQALASLSDSDSLFRLLQVLQRESVTVISLLAGLLRYTSQKLCSHPGAFALAVPSARGLPLSLFAPGTALPYPQDPTPRLCSQPTSCSASPPDLTPRGPDTRLPAAQPSFQPSPPHQPASIRGPRALQGPQCSGFSCLALLSPLE